MQMSSPDVHNPVHHTTKIEIAANSLRDTQRIGDLAETRMNGLMRRFDLMSEMRPF